MLLDKPLDDITEEDLQRLITNKVVERKTVEYKSALPKGNDDGHKEFLGDVSSFANAAGGWLIFGIEEVKGAPTALTGISTEDADKTILWLENMVRDGIRPRIGLTDRSTRAIPLASGGYVFIMQIARSYAAPHMVTFKGSSKFFARDSNGKYQLDVDELRDAFVRSEAIATRIRDFHLQQVANIIGDEPSFPLIEGAKIILHLVPFTAFDLRASKQYDIASLATNSNQFVLLNPITPGISSHRFNFDGFLTVGDTSAVDDYSRANGYVQTFRNGSIEAVDADLLRSERPQPKTIPGDVLEQRLVQALPRYLALLQSLGVEPPVALLVTLVNVRGLWMNARKADSDYYNHNNRAVLDIPEVILDSLAVTESTAPQTLRPIFDAVWNATGYPRSMNFDASGQWRIP